MPSVYTAPRTGDRVKVGTPASYAKGREVWPFTVVRVTKRTITVRADSVHQRSDGSTLFVPATGAELELTQRVDGRWRPKGERYGYFIFEARAYHPKG